MPNWCTNRVTVSGDKEWVQFFKWAVKGEGENDRRFSFNSIIPMPDELHGIGSPAVVLDTEQEVEDYKKEHADNPFGLENLPITRQRSYDLIAKYGHNNWYDWCTDNWTCKWDASDIYLDIEEEDYLQYRFETPWGPPEEIYNVLVVQHPKVHISWFYDEPGMEMAGYLNEEGE